MPNVSMSVDKLNDDDGGDEVKFCHVLVLRCPFLYIFKI